MSAMMDGIDLDHEEALQLIPRETYRPIMKKAMDRLPEFEDAEMLAAALFSRDQQEWLKKEYLKNHD